MLCSVLIRVLNVLIGCYYPLNILEPVGSRSNPSDSTTTSETDRNGSSDDAYYINSIMGFDIFAHSDQRVECNSQFIEYFGSNLTSTLETVFRETILSVKGEGANAQNANCFNEIVEISITIGNVTSAERGSEIVLLLKNLPDIEFAFDLLDSEYGLVLRQLSVKMTVHGIEKESRSHRMQNIVFVLVVAGVTVFVVLLSAIISLRYFEQLFVFQLSPDRTNSFSAKLCVIANFSL